ncbi:MAG: BCCT family transporter, partial [Clostridiaceae bacterium]|nr:BCCT family transporter [Clostridiaceae bacterium]
IRQFVLAVLIIPSLLSFIWLSVFGGAAMYINSSSGGALFDVVQDNLPVAMFEMINLLNFPILGGLFRIVLSILGTALVISFFITSSDSGSIVVDNIISGGKLDSPVAQRVFWACMEGLVASALLLIGGEKALGALQTAVISTGLPFAIILVMFAISLIKSLNVSHRKQKELRDVRWFEKIAKTVGDEDEK